MKIINLTKQSDTYTSNAYLLLGEWKAIDDVNTLIDVGRDHSIIRKIKQIDTGVGKKKVERVVLTHNRYDHVNLLAIIKKEFDPKVYAFHPFKGVSHALRDGQTLKSADSWFEVIHTPSHTSDSVCLYSAEESALFSVDTSLIVFTKDSSHQADFVTALERIARRDIRAIYPGHGDPITNGVKQSLYMSLDNVRKGEII